MSLNCNDIYFTELLDLLNKTNPSLEKFKKINKTKISKLNLVCDY